MRDFDWLDTLFLGDRIRDWLAALALVLLFLVVVALVKGVVVRRIARWAARTETGLDDFLIDLVRRTRWRLLILPAIFLGSAVLHVSPRAYAALRFLAILSLLLQTALWALAGIDAWVARQRRRQAADAASATLIGVLGFIGKLLLWTVVLLVVLDNLGVNITALVTGLGVGGIAVALAVQKILGDLLASLSIVLDKPFVIGDSITVGEFTGTVEHIGLRTTRLRSVSGEQVVFPNGDLLQSRIRNWARLAERRVVLVLSLDYATPPGTLERLPALVRQTIEVQPDLRCDRVHLRGFGPYGIELEAVYFVTAAEYSLYMDRQQTILLALLRSLEAEGVQLVYQGKTVLVEREEARPEDGK
ncbi:MAG TPA: mechanosensitive ion channel family protein [Thermoanaerobaculia bacterium]|nr:mechanosensitive ion channel family protein [Thermoanaerobaculia bacterium]